MRSRPLIYLTLALMAGMALPTNVSAATVPDSPTAVHAVAGNGSATVTWTAPSGAGALLSYAVTAYLGSTATVAAGPTVIPPSCNSGATVTCSSTVTGLTNGATYTFTVRDLNSVGWSAESARSNAITPVTVPGAPVHLDATPGNGYAALAWTRPDTGGIPITGYVVKSYLGSTATPATSATVNPWSCGGTGPADRCSATVQGLANGVTYTISVAATNTVGQGAAAFTTVIPRTVPAPPVNVRAVSGSQSAVVSWDPPASNGGSALTAYRVTAYLRDSGTVAQTVTVDGGVTSVTIGGLTGGIIYTFTVQAGNVAGWSAESIRSNDVAPRGSPPGQPANVYATAGNGSATVHWLPPATDGGSPITGYYITAYVGNTSNVATVAQTNGGATSVEVSGLANGVTYTFTVRAINAFGSSEESNRSSVVAPATVPEAPTDVRATAANGRATVSWTAPANGGSPITGYVVTASTGLASETRQMTVPGSMTSAIVDGLINGKTYTFTVVAFNQLGPGASSPPSNPTVPATVPGSPRNLTVTPGDFSAQVTWMPPASDGGNPISGYVVSATDGIHMPVIEQVTGTSATLTGLASDTTYSVTVVAANALGRSDPASTFVTLRNLPPVMSVPVNQTRSYGEWILLNLSAIDPEASDHLTLGAAGLPGGLTFEDGGNGAGTIQGTVQAPAGTYTVTLSASDGHGPAVSQTFTITVVHEAALVTPSGSNPLAVSVSRSGAVRRITLQARVTDSTVISAGDIAHAVPVTYTLTPMGSTRTYTCSAATRGGGVAGSLDTTCHFRSLPVNVYRIRIEVGGNFYQGSADTMLTVYDPSVGSVRGSGTLMRGDAQASLRFAARYLQNGRFAGAVLYRERHPSGDITLRSKTIDGLVVKGHRILIQGTASLNGTGTYNFVLTFIRGGTVRAGLWVTNGHNATVADLTFAPIGLAIG